MSFTGTCTAAVKALLEKTVEQGGLGIPFLDGERDGPSVERDLGCVFSPGFAEWNPDVNFVQPAIVVRVWKRRSKEPGQDVVVDPSDLYDLAEQLATLLAAVQMTLLPDGYIRMTGVRIHHADQGVEATLIGWRRNPAETVG